MTYNGVLVTFTKEILKEETVMKKTNLKTKKRLASAVAMLLISSMMLGTATYAWFSMNTTVTATGMNVKARAEEGLVIAPAVSGTYDRTATSVKTDVAELYPGSTADLTNWWHSVSTNPGAANTQQAYTAGTAWTANSGTYGNYVIHDFYIRSSADAALTVTSLNISRVDVTVNGGAALQDLSPSIRVGVRIAGDETSGTQNTYIFAPITGADTACTIQPGSPTGTTPVAYTGTGRINPAESTAPVSTAITSIPAKSQAGIHVEVFIWFEGEDSHCISNNLVASLQQLNVEVDFGYTAS